MKKGILSLCGILLVGCSQTPMEVKEEPPLQISTMFEKEGGWLEDTHPHNVINKRFERIFEHEWKNIRVVMDQENNEKAIDFLIEEKEQIETLRHLLSNAKLTDEKAQIQQRMILEFHFDEFEAVPLKITDQGVCYSEKDCLAFDQPISLYETLNEMEKEAIDVLPLTFDEATTNYHVWAQDWVKDNSDDNEPIKDEQVIEANPFQHTTEAKEVLKLALYMKEDFDDYHEIKEWKELVVGLALSQLHKGYSIYDGVVGPYYDRSMIYFKRESEGRWIDTVLVNEHLTEKAGKQIFGEDFVFPEIETGQLRGGLFGANYNAEQKLIEILVPYEAIYPGFDSARILREQDLGDVIEYELLFYTPSYDLSNFESPITSYINENGDQFDTIEGNEENFRQAQIILQKTETGYQFVSFKTTNSIVPEEIHEDEEGKPVDEISNPNEWNETEQNNDPNESEEIASEEGSDENA